MKSDKDSSPTQTSCPISCYRLNLSWRCQRKMQDQLRTATEKTECPSQLNWCSQQKEIVQLIARQHYMIKYNVHSFCSRTVVAEWGCKRGCIPNQLFSACVPLFLNNFYSLSDHLPQATPAGCSSAPYTSQTIQAQLPPWNLVQCEMAQGVAANADWMEQSQWLWRLTPLIHPVSELHTSIASLHGILHPELWGSPKCSSCKCCDPAIQAYWKMCHRPCVPWSCKCGHTWATDFGLFPRKISFSSSNPLTAQQGKKG